MPFRIKALLHENDTVMSVSLQGNYRSVLIVSGHLRSRKVREPNGSVVQPLHNDRTETGDYPGFAQSFPLQAYHYEP